ncbi:hypothetical protein [Kineococcus xinjiangensis]|uniref:hypothetical protein n=1 Tax=Kineococcus xinjiangensis TaxID=512762 RepID=UPI0011B02F0F|nr:hypothetical protein [Kineococcus xinjiangensis]
MRRRSPLPEAAALLAAGIEAPEVLVQRVHTPAGELIVPFLVLPGLAQDPSGLTRWRPAGHLGPSLARPGP